MLKHLDQRRRDDEGFTLIELMVVVLILGILMAIAIPTFLSTTKSANGVAAESNATNAATSEISYFSTNNTFLSSSAGTTLDPAIPWITSGTAAGNGQVVVDTGAGGATFTFTNTDTSSTTGQKVFLLEAQAKDGECYLVLDDQSATTPVVAYAAVAAGQNCPSISSITTDPTAAGVATAGKLNATGGAASNKNSSATISATFNWYNSF